MICVIKINSKWVLDEGPNVKMGETSLHNKYLISANTDKWQKTIYF